MTTSEAPHVSFPELAAVAGAANVRSAASADGIDDVMPALLVEPDSPAVLAAVLAWSARHQARVVLRGGGTHLTWGRPPGPFDLIVSTRGLSRVLHHEPGDLTVSVEAGMTLTALNEHLAAHQQCLPLDAPSEASTIGGLLAVNDSGPRRHRHGAPRDLLIGLHLATTDGRLVKAGGNVVKNVAGYDLGRLLCGSFGSLAAIVSATFKLAPLPAATVSVVADLASADALGRAASAMAASQLDPVCVDARVESAPGAAYRMLVRFAGLPQVNEAQAAEARRLLAVFTTRTVDAMGEAERDLWDAQTSGPWTASGTLVRLSWLPASLGAAAELMTSVARTAGLTMTLTARAVMGTGLLRFAGDDRAEAQAVAALRARPDLVSHVVIARAPRAVKTDVDVWGPPGDTLALLQRIKGTLDPHGVLNPGRGPV